MKAADASFLDLLGSSQTQFVIPVYQRVYSWEERECRDLWDDIMRSGRHGEPHFIGSFLYTPQDDSTVTSLKRELLIDGQQRMTTLSLMLAAFFDWLEEDESRASFLTDMKVSALRKHYLYNEDDYMGQSRYRLVLSQDDRDTLFAIVGKTPLPQERSERVVDAYHLFQDRVRARSFDAKALWEGIRRLLTYIESFLFRRAVVGRFTTGLNNFFAGMYRQIEAAANPEEYVTAMLLIHGEGQTAYFPTDDDFKTQLRTRDLYARFSKCRYCLERFENYHSPKEPIAEGAYQIEHVMPQEISNSPEWQAMLGQQTWQKDHEELVNTLGNLTLTGYNQEYSNSPFQTKLTLEDEGFKSSHLYLNRHVAKQTTWNRATIEERGRLLSEDALNIWPYPELDPAIVDAYRPKKKPTGGASWTLEEDHPLLAPGGICAGLFADPLQRDACTVFVERYV